MPMLATLRDLLIEELKDLYDAEHQLTQALPKMADAATNPLLREAFVSHLAETKAHVSRLEQVFDALGEAPMRKPCKAMKGLIDEGTEMMQQDADPEVKDAALISSAQRVEHYEIAGYGSVRTYAQTLGLRDIASLLQITLDEEGMADKKLTEIAQSRVNLQAAH